MILNNRINFINYYCIFLGAVVSDLPPVSITTDIPFVEAKTKTTKTTTESSTSTTTPVVRAFHIHI